MKENSSIFSCFYTLFMPVSTVHVMLFGYSKPLVYNKQMAGFPVSGRIIVAVKKHYVC
jgi:hypothetical protein